MLIDHFVARNNARLGTQVQGVSAEAMKRLLEHDWPGNVRELENVIERALILADGDRITLRELPEAVTTPRTAAPTSHASGDFSMRRARRRFESDLIQRALDATGGNRTRAARLLEISYRALLYKIKEYGLGDVEPE